MTYSRGGFASGGAGSASVIDRDSFFSGKFRSPQDLRIEGEYEGEIECEGTLTVAASARVSGTVNAGNVEVSGVLQGTILCNGRFEIHQTGQVSARVLAGTVVIREGAFYEGEMQMHVEPEGLPAREVTAISASVTEEPLPEESPEPTQLASRAKSRESGEVVPLRAGVEG